LHHSTNGFYRPQINGKTIAFHINDLKHHAASSSVTVASKPSYNGTSTPSPPNTRRSESDLKVILDLDECLIHSEFLDNPQDAALYAHQVRQTAIQNSCDPCESFRISLRDGELVHIHVRPGLIDFLSFVAQRYETHIFTAAMEIYAKPVLDHLCATVRARWNNNSSSSGRTTTPSSIFAGRWYREHCTYHPKANAYVKDLSKLPIRDNTNKGLSRVVLVDNNPLRFIANPENGILVDSFYSDSKDACLPKVTALLQSLEGTPDVRPVLTQRFQLAQLLAPATTTTTANGSVVVASTSSSLATDILDDDDETASSVAAAASA
jgi:CTD small phosphatase-like protein 2